MAKKYNGWLEISIEDDEQTSTTDEEGTSRLIIKGSSLLVGLIFQLIQQLRVSRG